MKAHFLFFVFFVFLIPSISFTQPISRENIWEIEQDDETAIRQHFSRMRQHDFDVMYYDLWFEPQLDTEILNGTTNITVKSMMEGLTEITLDFYTMTVDDVSMDGVSLEYTHNDTILIVDLPTPLNSDDEFTINITYHGHPEQGFQFLDEEIGTYSGAAGRCPYWFPCWNHPGDKADSVSIHITLPDDWLVVATGLETGVDDNDDGTLTHHWHSQYPIATYIIGLSASPNYQILQQEYIHDEGSMSMPSYVFSDNYNNAQYSFQNLPYLVEFFAEIFGEYPFIDEKYSQVASNTMAGGMENQTNTFIHPNFIDGTLQPEVWLYSHELAHQWFGDAITMGEPAEIWMNEGFASYAEALYYESLDFNIVEYIDSMLISYLSFVNYSGVDHAIYDPPEGFLLSTIEYEKGGLVLHMLRGVVGEENFFAILQQYFDEYKYGSGFTANFQQVCEDVTGNDLDWFFQQWIYEAGHPIFEIEWTSWETPFFSYTVEAQLKQVQDFGLYTMPAEVSIYCANGSTSGIEIEINDWDTYLDMVFIQHQPIQFIFDPERWFAVKEYEVHQIDKFSVAGVTVEDDNNNQILESDESAELSINLYNNLLAAQNITATLSTDDPAINIENVTTTYAAIGADSSVTNTENPFVISISSNIEPHMASFNLNLEINENGFMQECNFELFVGSGDILLIDDDESLYENYYIEALEELGFMPHPYDCNFLDNPTINLLNSFPAVIWFTGDAYENTLTEADQQNLATYLDNGGNLFLTGQDVGYDIGETDFYADYLHADLVDDEWGSGLMIKGMDDDPIGDGLMFPITGGTGGGNQESPSVIEPLPDAHKIFGYFPPMQGAAVRYEGTYKVVYFAFGFEGINSHENRVEVMGKVLSYLGLEVGIDDVPSISDVPQKFQLYPNYPNPFNPATTIQFEIPVASQRAVKLQIYDISGKLIKTLIDGEIESGYHSVVWNGKDDADHDVASGVYFYRIDADSYRETKSMLLLK